MPESKLSRIRSIDFVRGLVMVIMALDHCRDLFHVNADQNPTDLATTTPALFFTRWITHLCAPIFVFLSGTSAYLSLQSHGDPKAGRRFLLSRGLWLILLEFTVITFGIWFDIHFRIFMFQVIATIGCGFLILGLLIRVSPKTLGILGLILIFGHDLSSFLPIPSNMVLKFVESFLLRLGLFPVTPNVVFLMSYPVLPWTGIMLAGYGCGRLFENAPVIRRRLFLRIGLAALALFILLRFINIYGDPVPWSAQKNTVFTFLSFMNVSKYPPSLLYTLVTLGILFLLLAWAEGKDYRFMAVLSVYGKVPLFYYLIHWYAFHSLMFLMLFAQGFHGSDLVFGPFLFGRPKAPSGLTLPYVYLVWLSVVALLYPLCRWYGRYKSAHRDNPLLRYL